MEQTPEIGGVVGWPGAAGPFRVLYVRDDDTPGWVQVDGYEISRLPRVETTHRVPLARLVALPDPTYGGTP